MSDRQTPQWNSSSSDDDELDRSGASSSKGSSPFFTDDGYDDSYDDEYEDDYDDDSYDDDDDADDDEAYGSGTNAYGSSGSRYGSGTSRYGSGSSGSSGGSSYSSNRYGSSSTGGASSGGTSSGSSLTTTNRFGGASGSSSSTSSGGTGTSGRFGSSSLGAANKSSTAKDDKDKEKSGGGVLGRFGRGNKADKKAEPKSKDRAKTDSGSGIGSRLGGLRKRLPSGGGDKKDGGPSSSLSRNSTVSATRTVGPSRFGQSQSATSQPAQKADGEKKSRFGLSRPALPSFGRNRDGSKKNQPATPSNTKRAKPLPSRSKQPRITRTGISLDLKLDIAGWAMLIMAGIIFFGAISSNQGNVSRTILELLYQLVGVGWIVVPVALAGTGIWLIWRHFGEAAPEANYEHIIGWGITYLAFVATAHYAHLFMTVVYSIEQLAAFSQEAARIGFGGGWLGHQIYIFLMRNFGDYGTFFILLGWWGIGIIVATDISFADVFRVVDRGRHAVGNRVRRYQVARAAKKREQAVTVTAVGAAASLDELPASTTTVGTAAALESGSGTPRLMADTTAQSVDQPARSMPFIRHRSREPEVVSAEVTPAAARATPTPEPAAVEAPIPVEITPPTVAAYQPAAVEPPLDNETIKLNRGPAPMRIRRRTFDDYDYGDDDDGSDYEDYADYEEADDFEDDEALIISQPYQYSPPTREPAEHTPSMAPSNGEEPAVEAGLYDAPAEATPIEDDLPEPLTGYRDPLAEPEPANDKVAFTGFRRSAQPDDEPSAVSSDREAVGAGFKPAPVDTETDLPPAPAEQSPDTPQFTTAPTPQIVEPVAEEEIDDEEDDIAANLFQPAKPRSAGQRTLRPLRQRGAGLSPAERAALMGDFAGQEEDASDLDDSLDDDPVYEPVAEAVSLEEEIPIIELDDEPVMLEEDDEADSFVVDSITAKLTEDITLPTEPEEQEEEPAEIPEPEEIVAKTPITAPVIPEPVLEVEPEPEPEPEPEEIEIPEPVKAPEWVVPNYREVLDPVAEQNINDDVLLDRARIIEDTLASFGAPGKVVEVNPGPVITQFGIEPDYVEGRGGKRTRVKVQAIARLADDLALSLAARSIRIEAPVPGKGFVGIEVPNSETSLVSLRDVMDSPEFNKIDTSLAIGLGQSVDGAPVSADLTTMPHLLVAGTTGSGKSVCVNAIIACLLMKNTPDTLRLIMVDPKRVELTGYNGIPHLVAPVVVDLERIVGVLKWVTREMDDRYKKFNERSARNIISYNSMLGPDESPLPYLVVIIDELADLMMLAPDETERVLTRLAQMARATGIHLIISTQRPSVDVVTGLIKANFPSRVAFAVASSVDSRVILDQPGAERLLGKGDMLFQAPDAAAPTRLQGVYVSDTELDRLTNHWKGIYSVSNGQSQKSTSPLESSLSNSLSGGSGRSAKQVGPVRSRAEKYGAINDRQTSAPSSSSTNFWDKAAPVQSQERTRSSSKEVDELYDEAVGVVRQLKKASVSLLQRQLRIGYTRAARLIDVMEERGIVGPALSGSKPRKVIGYTDTEVTLDMDAPPEATAPPAEDADDAE